MILKKEKKVKKNYSLNKFFLIYFVSTSIIGIIVLVFVFQSVAFNQIKTKFLDLASKGGRFEYLYLPKIGIEAFKSYFFKLENINLEISFNNSLVLENIRAKSIVEGKLPSEEGNKEVNIKLLHNGEKYKGTVRLKGDRKVHFIDKEKSSYKIKLKKGNYLFGLSKFSLQKPRIRNYIHEWIFHQMAKDFNIIQLKYDFVELSINGEDKGLYAIEEGFGKTLIERNKRRNGPIFGLNEDITAETDNPVFEIYNKNYWAKEENKKLVQNASQKLRDFFNDHKAFEDVFDVNKWAAYFAIIDVTSTFHGALLKSVKLYYNPINGLFEPIPYDGHRLKPNFHIHNLNYDNRILIDIVNQPLNNDEARGNNWLKKIFYTKSGGLNSNFYNSYIRNLNIITSENYINNFLNKNLKKIQKINSKIYADYFFYDNSRNYTIGLYYFSLADFFHQIENIKNKLLFKKQILISIKNNNDFLIKNYYKNYGMLIAHQIECIKHEKRWKNNVTIKVDKILNNFSDTIIKLKPKQIKNLTCKQVNLIDKFSGKSFAVKIDYVNSEYNFTKHKNISKSQLSKYFVEKDKKLYLLNNEINITTDLYIPKGFRVIVKPGQKILITNNAFILSNSPWTIGGLEKKTYITGKLGDLGGGIIIGDNKEKSQIINTKISYLNGYNFDVNSEFLILGSINFHQTSVSIDNVKFENIYSEDAINIFRSKFSIKNSDYKNISSDAIDIDFSIGKIENVSFKNINNDAIDFSGSEAEVFNSKFENVNDKLISVGEESNVKISEVYAINSMSGIISKDGSKVYSSNIFFDNVKIPFASYQKKPQFNYGFLEVNDYQVNDYLVKFAKDPKSEVILDSVNQFKSNKDIISLVNQ